MTKKTTFVAIITTLVISLFFIFNTTESNPEDSVSELRKKHQSYIDNSPFKTTKKLSKKERLALGLPPNAYNEQMWELSLDPNTGRPMPERVYELQQQLKEDRLNSGAKRGVGGENANPWIDRGPNDQGGRTRGIMFDPNDTSHKRVFAGSVSGGLWVNQDITDANTSWTLVPNIGANISVTTIIYDPNNTNIFYIGSGESYVSGDAIGRGVWKSTDGGVTWVNIFGGFTSSDGGQLINGIFYINDIVARNNMGSTELFIAVAGAFYSDASSPNQFHGLNEQGIYKSTDNGANWTRLTLTGGTSNPKNPNDIELDINNNVWFTTTRSSFGTAGGEIWRSTDGSNFSLITTIADANRTELEPSSLNANTFWVATQVSSGGVSLFKTTDAFTNTTQLTEPNDVDTGISTDDYTRGQSFYDLPIEVDSQDNLYVGGIDLFRSTQNDPSGNPVWIQISKWSNNNNLAALNVSEVHADQHAIVFRPGNDSQIAFGNDGGVYYSDGTTLAGSVTGDNIPAISDRNKDYNTLQPYYGTIDENSTAGNDGIAGGTQDNGTQVVVNATNGANGFHDPFTGDGGYTEIDGSDANPYMIQAYTGDSHNWSAYPPPTTDGSRASTVSLTSGSGNFGNFINEAVLDKNLDILYCNSNNGSPRIERIGNFKPTDTGGRQNDFYTDALLDSDVSALNVSPDISSTPKLYAGLNNGSLLILSGTYPFLTFSSITNPFVGSISDIEFGQNESEIFVTIHNYGVTSIWFTNNAGTTWRSIEGNLPDLPVKCILQNPLIPTELIIGTELGVWATANYTVASPVWVQAYNGMSDVTVLDLDVRPSDNMILATTHGRGFFTSNFTSSPLSIGETSLTKQVSLYPTVSNGELYIKSKTALGDAQIQIFDLSGKTINTFNIKLSTNVSRININNTPGIYIVKINGANFIETKKIILK